MRLIQYLFTSALGSMEIFCVYMRGGRGGGGERERV